ncbi:MAG TPA: FIST N-terminal domain-containing protein [Saprospiraceae bacterium]|nr:hypothetical protein [Saprospirales bacterium]HRQ31148.1 FIST N-terminal domain-containing protein [Saprospiraceae bacterium]
MKTEQLLYSTMSGWEMITNNNLSEKANLIFIFGDRELLKQAEHIDYLKKHYPNAQILGCSTSGEICQTTLHNEHLVCTAVWFEKSQIKTATATIKSMEDSFSTGAEIGQKLDADDLIHVMVFAEGLNINGSELAKGLNSVLKDEIPVTGGLAGDQADFKETVVVGNQVGIKNFVSAIGFYGKHLKTGNGSMGGWNSFGADRLVTKSDKNVLYELDGQPALELYKKYLGDHVAGLPASALLFPLSLQLKDRDSSLIRTVLSIDETDGSMVFAGDIPQGEYVRLMTANSEKLIDGASLAAEMSLTQPGLTEPDLAVLISCVGRKLVLKQRAEEELEAVKEVLGGKTTMTGYYSYGELCPINLIESKCELHNQTMTITLFKEI